MFLDDVSDRLAHSWTCVYEHSTLKSFKSWPNNEGLVADTSFSDKFP